MLTNAFATRIAPSIDISVLYVSDHANEGKNFCIYLRYDQKGKNLHQTIRQGFLPFEQGGEDCLEYQQERDDLACCAVFQSQRL